MGLTRYFDRIYVINLPDRKDRLRDVERQLELAGIPFEPGKVELFPGVRVTESGDFYNVGCRGCFLSHMGCLQKAAELNLNRVIVMEDDIALSPTFARDMDELTMSLESRDWSFAYFGHSCGSTSTLASRWRDYSDPMMLAHFYAINGNALAPLNGFLRQVLERPGGHPDGGPMAYDGALSFFRERNPEYLTLIADPNLAEQRSSRSDITPSWIDRVPVLKRLAIPARQLKASWQRTRLSRGASLRGDECGPQPLDS